MDFTTKSVLKWEVDDVVAWLNESKLGDFEKIFRDNEIDGLTLLKLNDAMVVRLFPTIRLEIQFIDLLNQLKQKHSCETNGSTLSSCSTTSVPAQASSSFDDNLSNSSSPSNHNNHSIHYNHHKISQISRQTPKPHPPKMVKREPKYYSPASLQQNLSLNAGENGNNGSLDSGEHDTKHSFPHIYQLPAFPDTLRLALLSQDPSAFKLRTYYRNLLISSLYDDLTRTYNLWYPNARQYKTVASALVKAYPFLEQSTDGGESAWVDGIKGKFKRGRRTVTSYTDVVQPSENGMDNSNGHLGGGSIDQFDDNDENKPHGQKRSRHELELDTYSDNEDYESGEMMENQKDQEQNSENNDELDDEESNRLRGFIHAMQEAMASSEPDLSLITDYFKETFHSRRSFVKTHNTTEILSEYPALTLQTCLLTDFHMQTNIPIQTVFIHKLRSISKSILRLAKETSCAPEILQSYHAIVTQRPQLDQILADTFALLIVSRYFDEDRFLLTSSEKDTNSPWPIIRGDHPANSFYDGKSISYNIELDYIRLFSRPLNDFLTAIITLFAVYTVFEITYGKLEMTLSFIDCLLRENQSSSTRPPQVIELINELNSMK
ncbi:unnamed protein product [Didymodactylos carnosus]|uniref:SAM domain-containing protein n=1 Tax=Didymodactylos carnosus TaxID=1234261 RepID=A0A813S070_9BILA|nr:unnamed protein product [Didymodactylos carnosus]CAF0987734.1 unnamed protein product [Didymodactylos carnosus]CAF3571657.1 unnamed protein product [Didymodactylos carnosus]CAF3757941.1 unnamed protein product [Didymodactylos carnosus]